MNKKEKYEIEILLKSNPNEFRIIEDKINAKIIDEYYNIAEHLENKNQAKIIQNQYKWTELKLQKDIKELLVCFLKLGM